MKGACGQPVRKCAGCSARRMAEREAGRLVADIKSLKVEVDRLRAQIEALTTPPAQERRRP